jgi:hypothetical protein
VTFEVGRSVRTLNEFVVLDEANALLEVEIGVFSTVVVFVEDFSFSSSTFSPSC